MSKPSGRRSYNYRGPTPVHRGCRVEDIDGLTCLLRSALPLTDDDRAAIAEFATHLVSADVDELVDAGDVELDQDSVEFLPLDDATVWLHPADPQLTGDPKSEAAWHNLGDADSYRPGASS